MKPLLKAEDVLEILGISLSTLRRWERVGKIRRVRLSTRCIRYHHDEIYRIIKKHTI